MICRCRMSCLHSMVKLPHVGQRRRLVSMCMRHSFQKWSPAVAVWCHWMWFLQYPQRFLVSCSRDEGWQQSIKMTSQLASLILVLQGTMVFPW